MAPIPSTVSSLSPVAIAIMVVGVALAFLAVAGVIYFKLVHPSVVSIIARRREHRKQPQDIEAAPAVVVSTIVLEEPQEHSEKTDHAEQIELEIERADQAAKDFNFEEELKIVASWSLEQFNRIEAAAPRKAPTPPKTISPHATSWLQASTRKVESSTTPPATSEALAPTTTPRAPVLVVTSVSLEVMQLTEVVIPEAMVATEEWIQDVSLLSTEWTVRVPDLSRRHMQVFSSESISFNLFELADFDDDEDEEEEQEELEDQEGAAEEAEIEEEVDVAAEEEEAKEDWRRSSSGLETIVEEEETEEETLSSIQPIIEPTLLNTNTTPVSGPSSPPRTKRTRSSTVSVARPTPPPPSFIDLPHPIFEQTMRAYENEKARVKVERLQLPDAAQLSPRTILGSVKNRPSNSRNSGCRESKQTPRTQKENGAGQAHLHITTSPFTVNAIP